MIIKGNKREYKVISVWMVVGQTTIPLTKVDRNDVEELTRQTKLAEAAPGSTWDLFGGTIDIGTRSYQLA